ncbi:MAG TPA: molybdopterin-synthase adenylyltransferase MoeB [Bacteroidota bacterium]|nr:molybdopterin-synthase adenylyltransferase MoeB [Bacteroidota bacterium]
MEVKFLIPTPFRKHTGNSDTVIVHGQTVEEALISLTEKYSPLYRHLFSDDGTLRGFINVYINDNDIRYLEQGRTGLKDADVISIIPSIAGGIDVRLPDLSQEEILRYSRHVIMPEVGMEGQKKLKAASVLVIGAGGLGSPVCLYLAAAGIGKLGIVDFDVVDVTNLQRQILHSTENIGRSKLDSARERISEINPHVETKAFNTMLTSKNAMDILCDFDVIIDGTDNFATRYLVNDACVLLGKPNVYGSIFRFEGQVSLFDAKRGPCYRCLYPSPPPPGLVPSCAEGGVLGVLPGIIGTLQALEAMKLITGQGESLAGRLVLFDALALTFRELKLKKNPNCPVCGEHPSIRELIDYEEFCGVQSHQAGSAQKPAGRDNKTEITPKELKERLDRGEDIAILDVREPVEHEICSIGGKLIPLGSLRQRMNELDPEHELVVYCKTGRRSGQAAELLRKAGFKQVENLVGGITAWAADIDPKMARY